MTRKKIATSLILLLALILAPLHIHAQQATQPGIVVTPALIEASISSTAPEATTRIVVRNTFAYPLELVAVLGGLEQEGTRLVPSGPIEPQLAGAMTFEPNIITVQPTQEAVIVVHFRNTDELAPGGHYGSITIRQSGGVTGRVGLQAAVSVGIFLTKEDGAMRSATVTELRTDGSIFALPSHADVTFQNKGNVIVVPRASVELAGAKNVIAKGVANMESIGVLPGSTVTIRAPLLQAERAWVPGFYTTTVTYRVDGSSEQSVSTIKQFYVPPIILGVAILGIATWYFFVRRHRKPRKQKDQKVHTGAHAGPTTTSARPTRHIDVSEPNDGEKIPVRKA